VRILNFQKPVFEKHVKVRVICHFLFRCLICFDFQVVAYDHNFSKFNCSMHVILFQFLYLLLYIVEFFASFTLINCSCSGYLPWCFLCNEVESIPGERTATNVSKNFVLFFLNDFL